MIGLLAAAALLGLSLWLLADWWLVPSRPPRPIRPASNPISDRLDALGQVLVEAELEHWRPGVVVISSGAAGLVVGVAVFQILEGDFEMMESYAYTGAPEKRIAHRKLMPVATVKAGKLYGSASIPVVRG